MLMFIFAVIGGTFVSVLLGILFYAVVVELQRIHRVSKHYHDVADDYWREKNYFSKLGDKVVDSERRMYRAERDASNACFRIDSHVKDNKHTKTAKAIKRDKRRKDLERDTGTGGM